MKTSLKTDSVRTVVQETFKLDDEKTEEIIDKILADEEANAEPKEDKPKREKRFVFIVPDPDGTLKLASIIKDGITGFIVEMLPTPINEHGVVIHGEEPREWGELEAEKMLETIVEKARNDHSKRGPYEIVGDIIDGPPKKFLKEMGMSPITTMPVALIPVKPSNLYTDSKTRKKLSDNVEILQ